MPRKIYVDGPALKRVSENNKSNINYQKVDIQWIEREHNIAGKIMETL